MRVIIHQALKPLIILFAGVLFCSSSFAQGAIDWGKDTVSKVDANAGRAYYVQNATTAGQKNITQKVTFPVSKLKAILDFCAARQIPEVSFMITTLRQYDLPRYRRNHPEYTGTDDKLRGMQVLILRVPRRAFGTSGAGINIQGNAIMVSLLGFGIMLLDQPYGMFEGDDYYFDMGTLCPPPAACD